MAAKGTHVRGEIVAVSLRSLTFRGRHSTLVSVTDNVCRVPPQSDSKARLAKVVRLRNRLSSALLRNVLEHCNKSTLKRIRLAIGRAGRHIAFEHAVSQAGYPDIRCS